MSNDFPEITFQKIKILQRMYSFTFLQPSDSVFLMAFIFSILPAKS